MKHTHLIVTYSPATEGNWTVCSLNFKSNTLY